MQADYEAHAPLISPDGSYVASNFYASNLVLGDTNGANDIFVTAMGARTPRQATR
jgi:hypothetical protein